MVHPRARPRSDDGEMGSERRGFSLLAPPRIDAKAERGARAYYLGGQSASFSSTSPGHTCAVTRKREDRVLTGRQPWELRSCELVFASVEVLHSVAAGPPTQ